MKNKHIFWGIFFIAIGIFILINNVTSYNFFYEEVWKIWPFVLILLGISLMIKHELIRSVIVGMTALVLAFAVFSTFATAFDVFDNNFVHDYKDSEVTINDEYKINNYFESFRGKTSGATLNFDAGAGSFAITGTSDSLFEAKTEGANWNYNLVRSDRNNDTSIDFMMKKKRVTFRDGKFHNKVQMKLNPAPVWNINMNVGAAAIDLDLSKIKVNDLYIEMGAAMSGLLTEKGFCVRRIALYQAVAAQALDPAAYAALAGGTVAGAVFFSPRTARSFVTLAVDAGGTDLCRGVVAYCLSPAVATVLRTSGDLGWSAVRSAAAPDQESLLALPPPV